MSARLCYSTGRDQRRLLSDIVSATNEIPDSQVEKIVGGSHLVGITSARMGLCTNVNFHGESAFEKLRVIPESAKDLAEFLLEPPTDISGIISYAMAAINSILPIPKRFMHIKAQQLILEKGKGKNVAIIGHFPFVEKLKGEFRNFWVFELCPRPGDLPVETAAKLLPRADVVAITAATLLNGTCAEILNLTHKDAFVIMLGPSTPFVPCLFDWGVDALAGCYVVDESITVSLILEGVPFTRMQGVNPIIWIA